MSEATQIVAKTARLEARVTDEQKALLQHAADLVGRSLTDFVVSSAQEVAARTVREHEVLTLSGRDREIFVEVAQTTFSEQEAPRGRRPIQEHLGPLDAAAAPSA